MRVLSGQSDAESSDFSLSDRRCKLAANRCVPGSLNQTESVAKNPSRCRVSPRARKTAQVLFVVRSTIFQSDFQTRHLSNNPTDPRIVSQMVRGVERLGVEVKKDGSYKPEGWQIKLICLQTQL